MSGAALFAFGAGITVKTGQQALVAGLRQHGFWLAAATTTFAIGTVLRAAIS